MFLLTCVGFWLPKMLGKNYLLLRFGFMKSILGSEFFSVLLCSSVFWWCFAFFFSLTCVLLLSRKCMHLPGFSF